MLKNIQLRIDKPCSADWDRMSTEEQGRFCLSCQKTVVDFTGMSDQQVLNWLSRSHGSVCGRLEGHQLNRGLMPQPQRRNSRLGLWSYLLAGLLVSSEASAQDKPARPPISQQDSNNTDKTVVLGKISAGPHAQLPEREVPDTLRGRLIDSGSGLPVPFATITIDSHHGYGVNDKGYFAIPRKNIPAEHLLKISAIGYKVLTIDVTKTWTNDQREKVISMSRLENTLMGDVVMIRQTRAQKGMSFFKDTLARIGRIFK